MADIDVLRVQEYFKDNLVVLAQQKVSKLRPFVQEMKMSSKLAFIDTIGKRNPSLVSDRHGDSPINDQDFNRRRLELLSYNDGDMVDKKDIIRIARDPKSKIVEGMVHGFNRQIDDLIIAAAQGTAYAGEAGATAVPLPSGQKVAAGGVGITKDKLISARKILLANDVDLDGRDVVLAVNAAGWEDLIAIAEFVNLDYVMNPAIPTGIVGRILGMNVVQCERLPAGKALVMTDDAIALGVGEDIRVEVAVDPSKQFNYRIYAEMSMAAVRVEDEKVVEISYS